jgi:hypothetical protein
MREAIRLQGLNQDSDLAELKEALDEVDAQFHRNRSNQDRNQGRSGNQAEAKNSNRNQDRSRTCSRSRTKTTRYDYSNGPAMKIVEAAGQTQGAAQVSTFPLMLMHRALFILA